MGEPWPPPSVDEPLHDNGSTLHFTPSSITATRIPATCGTACPAFTSEDLYLFDVVGEDAHAGPLNAFPLTFTSAVKVGQPIDLEIGTPSGDGQPAQQAGSCISCKQPTGIEFGFSYGTNPAEIDTTPYDRATITFLAFSPEPGALVSYRLELHFTDGKTLDMTFTSHLWSSWSSCPAG